MPKIGAVLLLIILILVGAALVGLAVAVLRRPRRATKAPKVPNVRKAESVGGEREVYERLYGKPRSKTVSIDGARRTTART